MTQMNVRPTRRVNCYKANARRIGLAPADRIPRTRSAAPKRQGGRMSAAGLGVIDLFWLCLAEG